MASIFKYDINKSREKLRTKIDEEFCSKKIRKLLDAIPKHIDWEPMIADMEAKVKDLRSDGTESRFLHFDANCNKLLEELDKFDQAKQDSDSDCHRVRDYIRRVQICSDQLRQKAGINLGNLAQLKIDCEQIEQGLSNEVDEILADDMASLKVIESMRIKVIQFK